MNIISTVDNGFLVGGASESGISGDKTEYNLGSRQSWIIKTDSVGNKLWDKTIFSMGSDDIGLVLETGDGCYIVSNNTNGGIGGYKTEPSWGFNDFWLVKFCDTTQVTAINEYNSHFEFKVTPNPVENFMSISVPYSLQNATIRIYDCQRHP